MTFVLLLCVCVNAAPPAIGLRHGPGTLSSSCARRADRLHNSWGTCPLWGSWAKTGKTQTEQPSGSAREHGPRPSPLPCTSASTFLTPMQQRPWDQLQGGPPFLHHHTGLKRHLLFLKINLCIFNIVDVKKTTWLDAEITSFLIHLRCLQNLSLSPSGFQWLPCTLLTTTLPSRKTAAAFSL